MIAHRSQIDKVSNTCRKSLKISKLIAFEFNFFFLIDGVFFFA